MYYMNIVKWLECQIPSPAPYKERNGAGYLNRLNGTGYLDRYNGAGYLDMSTSKKIDNADNFSIEVCA